MAGAVAHFDKTGFTQITEKEWADAVAGINQAAEKFFLKNVGDRPLNAGTFSIVLDIDGDGDDQMRLADDDNDTLSPPWGPAEAAPDVVVSAGSGSWTPGTYGVVVTARNSNGETNASAERTFVIANATDEALVDWEPVTGADDYRVYLTPTPGTYGATSLRATVTAPTTQLNMTGNGGLASGTPPSANTTGGAAPDYGTEPAVFTTAARTVPALAEGQMWPYWVKRVVPLGTPEAGNDRTADLEYLEGTV